MGTVTADPTTAPPPLPDSAGGPLSPEQLEQLSQANRRARKALGAARVASFNAWTTAVIALVSVPFILTGPTAAVMTVALAAVAFNEFRGRRLVRAFQPRGARVLAWNQLGFMAVLIGYALWRIYTGLTGPQPYEAEIERMPELAKSLGSVAALQRTVTLAVYGGLIAGTLLFQGMTALYYFRCAKHIRAYVQQAPQWVFELLRQVSGQ